MNIPASAADVKQIFTAVDNMPNRITNYRKMHRAEREALMEEMLNLISILTVRYEDIGNCAPEIERKGLPAHEYHASICGDLHAYLDHLASEVFDTWERALELANK